MNSITNLSQGHEAALVTHLPENVRARLKEELGNDLNYWFVYQISLDQIEETFHKRDISGGTVYVIKFADRIAIVVERIFKDIEPQTDLDPRLKVLQYQNGHAFDSFSDSVTSESPQARPVVQKYRDECSFVVFNGYMNSLTMIRDCIRLSHCIRSSQEVDGPEIDANREWGSIANAGEKVMEMLGQTPECLNEREELTRGARAEIKHIEEAQLWKTLADITRKQGSNLISLEVTFLDET